MASRIIEGVILFMATIFPLMIAHGRIDGELASLFVFAFNQAFQIGMLSLSLGSLIFCVWLLRFIQMPKWLSINDIVGYGCLFISCIIALFPTNLNIINYLYIPGAIFEVLFPIYLIVKPLKTK